MKRILLITLFASVFAACDNGPDKPDTTDPKPEGPKSMTYSIVDTFPHDTSSFTEGLLIYNGEMYESTGDYGKSNLLKVDMKTGKILKSLKLDDKFFGEGIVIIHDTVYQMTYREKAIFMYSLKDFKKIGEFTLTAAKEGWGMTTDGTYIIASDGSSNLFYYEPGTFRLVKKLEVVEAGTPLFNINELEFINGYIYANQYQLPYILKIDPATGVVVAKSDLTNVTTRIRNTDPNADVLNGIAYDPLTKKIYITGKKWAELYEVQFGQ